MPTLEIRRLPIRWRVALTAVLIGCSGTPEHNGDRDGDGWHVEDGDCDDRDSSVHPEATDLPDNGVDEDCNGFDAYPGTNQIPLSEARFQRTGEARSHLGHSIRNGGDTNGDGFDDLLIGAPWFSSLGESADGLVYLFAGPLESGLDNPTATFTHAKFGEELGWSAVGLGDSNGDGFGDIALAGPRSYEAAPSAGAVHVWRGPVTGTHSAADAQAVIYGATDDLAGSALEAPGDLDGDGLGDLIIGTPNVNAFDGVVGAVHIFQGALDGVTTTADADFSIVGEHPADGTGIAIASGDVDGDGYTDLLVGSQQNDESGYQAGKAYLVLGPLQELALTDAAASFTAESAGALAGNSVAILGDQDGDGVPELVVGSPNEDPTGSGERVGRAYVLDGANRGSWSLADADGFIAGDRPWEVTGAQVAAPGDLDGDGRDDLVVSAPASPWQTPERPGRVLLFTDVPSGEWFNDDAAITWIGERAGDHAGSFGLRGVGDVDGDGLPDLGIGSVYNDEGGDEAGKAYVVTGARVRSILSP